MGDNDMGNYTQPEPEPVEDNDMGNYTQPEPEPVEEPEEEQHVDISSGSQDEYLVDDDGSYDGHDHDGSYVGYDHAGPECIASEVDACLVDHYDDEAAACSCIGQIDTASCDSDDQTFVADFVSGGCVDDDRRRRGR